MNSKKIYTALFLLILFCLALILFKVFCAVSDSKSDKIYAQGLEFYKKGDYQNAYYNFKQIPFLSSYSSQSLYRQGACAWELADEKTALKKYSKFAKIYKNSDFAAVAIWRSALLQLNLGNKRRAYKLLNKLVEKHPNTDFAKAAYYQLGTLTYKTDREAAKKYLIDYIEYAPVGRYSAEVMNMLQTYRQSELTEMDKYYMAIVLYENGYYSKSVSLLKEVPFDTAWVYLVKNYDKTTNYNELQRVILKAIGLKQLPDGFSEKEMLDVMSLYMNKSNLPSKQAAHNLVYSSQNTNNYPLALFIYSKYVPKSAAMKNYEKIYSHYPNSVVAPDALWFNFWQCYKVGNFNKALELFKLSANVQKDFNIQPKIMYWGAKIQFKLGHKKIAKSTLQNIVNNFPCSYYAFRSNAILKRRKNPWIVKNDVLITNRPFVLDFPMDVSSKEYSLLSKFADLKDYEAIQSFKIDDKFLNSWLYAMQGNAPYSVVLARDAINDHHIKVSPKSSKFKLAYPLYYKDIVNKNASKYNVNAYLLISLMREESFFNPKAVSPTDARGLMQLMPSTAQMVASNYLGNDKLFDPEYNIELGSKYFASLVEEFNGNYALAVLAYNSGPNSVKRWLKNSDSNDFDEFVEDIPYSETANYIKKVYSSYWSYTNAYGRGN